MGKTKSAKIGDTELKDKRPGVKSAGKVHVAGLKGGQRVKAIEIENPDEVKDVEKVEKKPKVRSKKYREAKEKIDKNKFYEISDAVALAKETSTTKFDGTIEMHLVIKKTGFSTNITFPHAFGKQKKIEIADEETIKKLQSGKIDFDILLATPDMMPKLVTFARILGPKGLMPNPKNGTLINSAKEAKNFATNAITLKTEKEMPVVHTTIGKASMKENELKENYNAVIEALGKNQLVKAYISPTMGPSIKLAV